VGHNAPLFSALMQRRQMPNTAPPHTADRSFDLSLRLLTALVVIALGGSVSFLAYRWLGPRFSQIDSGTIATKIAPRPDAPTATVSGATHGDEVLMDPRRVFRCEEQGRVSFSDQACPSAAPASHSHPGPAGR